MWFDGLVGFFWGVLNLPCGMSKFAAIEMSTFLTTVIAFKLLLNTYSVLHFPSVSSCFQLQKQRVEHKIFEAKIAENSI